MLITPDPDVVREALLVDLLVARDNGRSRTRTTLSPLCFDQKLIDVELRGLVRDDLVLELAGRWRLTMKGAAAAQELCA